MRTLVAEAKRESATRNRATDKRRQSKGSEKKPKGGVKEQQPAEQEKPNKTSWMSCREAQLGEACCGFARCSSTSSTTPFPAGNPTEVQKGRPIECAFEILNDHCSDGYHGNDRAWTLSRARVMYTFSIYKHLQIVCLRVW